MWKTIETSADIQDLMDIFGGFHDSCLKEVRYNSGMQVNSDLRMGNTGNTYARLIF